MQDIDPSLVSWVSQSQPGAVAGADPSLVGAGDWLDWEEELEEGGVELRPTGGNIIDLVWTADNGRPPPSYKDIVVLGREFAGVDWEDKVREQLAQTERHRKAIHFVDLGVDLEDPFIEEEWYRYGTRAGKTGLFNFTLHGICLSKNLLLRIPYY